MADAEILSSVAALEMFPCRNAVVKYSIAFREVAITTSEIPT
jgi:hypothetical protein